MFKTGVSLGQAHMQQKTRNISHMSSVAEREQNARGGKLHKKVTKQA
jgi:hypothetical protein